MSKLQLPYFYGHEAEQYAFYLIPKQLISDSRFRSISTDAKLLYGLMLDRMSLSVKNGWLDDKGRVYIYFVLSEIQELLQCGHGRLLLHDLRKPADHSRLALR